MNFFRAVGISGAPITLEEGIVAAPRPERRQRLDHEPIYTEGFEPRGKTSGGIIHVWSHSHQEVMSLKPKELHNSSMLTAICGGEWLRSKYSKKSPRDGAITTDYTTAGDAIDKACKQLGLTSDQNVRGGGVWRDGQDFIVNSHSLFYAEDRKFGPRFDKGNIYVSTHDFKVRPDQPEATIAEIADLHALVQSLWWSGGWTHATLFLGAIAAGYFPAALDVRPHMFVKSDKSNAGKTTARKIAGHLLGDAAIVTTAQGEAGIRQLLKDTSLTILVEEAGKKQSAEKSEMISEHDKKLMDLMMLLRKGFDGVQSYAGSQTHVAVKFDIRMAAILFGVSAPTMTEEDASRFVEVELDSAVGVEANGRKPHRLFPKRSINPGADEELKEIGKRFFSRMLTSLPRFDKAVGAIHAAIRSVSEITSSLERTLDTLTPFIAGAWCALNDGFLTRESALEWVKKFEIEDQKERIAATAPGDEFLNRLSGSPVPVRFGAQVVNARLSEVWARAAFESSDNEPHSQALLNLGMKIRPMMEKVTVAGKAYKQPVLTKKLFPTADIGPDGEFLYEVLVRSPLAPQLVDMFARTSFNNVAERIKSIPHASKKLSEAADVRFGFDGQKKYLSIPFVRPEWAQNA